jgi:lysophospholipase L1-like esterase
MWLELVSAAMLAAGTPAGESTRFLALGDSYTIGEGVAAEDRWPSRLAVSLRQAGLPIDAPEILARTGWTTDELSAAMDAHTFHAPYALVTLLIGVNNQYRGRDLANYRTEFRGLLERAIALTGGRPQRVVVVSIPDWGVTRFGHASGRDVAAVAREIDAFNSANVEIATMLRVRYADVTAISRDRGGDADMLVDDGLHPSAAMYQRWLATIESAAKAALSSH